MPRRSLMLLTAATLATPGVAAAIEHAARTAAAPRLTLEADAPLFDARNASDLVPGERRSACLVLRHRSGAATRPALRAPRIAGPLAPHLVLTVTRGRGRIRSCTDFTALRVIFHGPLTTFRGTVDPHRWHAGELGAYRFDLQVADDPAAAGRGASWTWAVSAATKTTAPSRCATLHAGRILIRLRGRRLAVSAPKGTRVLRINGRRPANARLRRGRNTIVIRRAGRTARKSFMGCGR